MVGRSARRALLAVTIATVFVTTAGCVVLPAVVESAANGVLHPPPYEASPEARALHDKLVVADLHADSLLWGRDLAERGRRGHVDVPRLIEGNVALQAFTIVTKVPRTLDMERNEADALDVVTLLALFEMWPRATWSSLTERALHQAGRLRELDAEREDFFLVETREDLASYLERRRREPRVTAGFLGVEGAHALDGKLDNVDVLFEAGVRMMAPTHFFDTELGGSAHGVEKGGLTDMGRQVIARMETLGITLDLAHASPALIAEALAIATKPVVISHTGVTGTCPGTRNLTDDQLRAVAATGGVIGIGFWETAVCGTDAAAIARAIVYAVDVVGADRVALGSDFDGAVATPFDATGLVQIVDELLAAGMDEDAIAMIMGANVVRVLEHTLPPAS